MKENATDILGVKICADGFEAALNRVAAMLEKDGAHTVFTPNAEMLVLASKKPAFRKILNSAELLVPDGIGVVLASKLNRAKIRERVSGVDLCQSLFERFKGTGKTFYLLGSKPGVAERARAELEKKYGGLKIVGVSDGYFDDEKEKRIIRDIEEKKPDILLVGLGMERQESWIYKNAGRLNAKLLIGVGGSIDIFSGDVKRSPKIFQRLGLEWLYRMITLRRFKRQLAIPKFAFLVIKNKFTRGGA